MCEAVFTVVIEISGHKPTGREIAVIRAIDPSVSSVSISDLRKELKWNRKHILEEVYYSQLPEIRKVLDEAILKYSIS